jgi:hypothetical protein
VPLVIFAIGVAGAIGALVRSRWSAAQEIEGFARSQSALADAVHRSQREAESGTVTRTVS